MPMINHTGVVANFKPNLESFAHTDVDPSALHVSKNFGLLLGSCTNICKGFGWPPLPQDSWDAVIASPRCSCQNDSIATSH